MRMFIMNKPFICIILVIILLAMSACTFKDLANTNGSTGSTPQRPTYGTAHSTQPSVSIAPQESTPPVMPKPEFLNIYQFGDPLYVELTTVQTELLGFNLKYSWTCYDGQIFIGQYEGSFPLSVVYGSNRYIYTSVSNMTRTYHYLIDAQTGTVLDPLARLDPFISEHISEVSFSPNGGYALICSHSSTSAALLDCDTGYTMPLFFVAENVYSVSGFFPDNSHVFLTSCFQNAQGQFYYTFICCNILTGEVVYIPGEYQTVDKAKDNFIRFSDGGILYTFTEGKLTIIDPLTWEMTAYPFPDDATVSYYTADTYIVSTNDIRYLLHKNGTFQLIYES